MAEHKLHKQLGLFDVFSISTGAMFSSGFFLLPGLASRFTGPSVFVAYLAAGILMLPAVFSIAEIATALPRSGGVYFFLDRSMGPLMGTIGGLGTYLALILKTSFAIVGIGAYAALFWDVPVKTVAVSATLFFLILNLKGAKEATRLQNFFVVFLILVLITFILDGTWHVIRTSPSIVPGEQGQAAPPFFSHGMGGFLTTIGFVFVSYLGVTQIASVAEEVKNPERNIPLGMILSLVVTSLIYFFGVFLMVKIIPHTALATDISPAATASKQLFQWLPGRTGIFLMAGAAIAAFASTGNAGLFASSRYPFAMSRDKLFPPMFARINRQIPIYSLLLSAGLILLFIIILSEEGIAKLASTFQLIIFALINFSVIVFRNSRIEAYDPGFKSPFYPFLQVAGILIYLVLIIYMGWGPVGFSLVIILISFLWYRMYVRKWVAREGAIYHWFALLGKSQDNNLENEFMMILKEKGLRMTDPFDQTVVVSHVFFLKENFHSLRDIHNWLVRSEEVPSLPPGDSGQTSEQYKEPDKLLFPVPGVAINSIINPAMELPKLHILINRSGLLSTRGLLTEAKQGRIDVLFVLIHPPENPKQQLRMLARLIGITEREDFLTHFLAYDSVRSVKEYLLQNEHFISLVLKKETAQSELIGRQMKDITLPEDVLVALVERKGNTFPPRGHTLLKEGDILTIIGEPKSIAALFDKYMKLKE
ncbi:amino acid permease [Prolixibacter sp. SD074]|uniref:amino acid permease n=1 Tax=Prolixibacter sp. SD074 TaxID=2652391 RepID=UPI00127880F5|nr:amino acid permease [Prolixibacter sp. SD074]GET29456.1 amino acid transporter [Prolixibacter sp. SD074]